MICTWCFMEKPVSGELICEGTLLVPSQIMHFFGLEARELKFGKNAFLMEVVQKLKFPNNPVQLLNFYGVGK